MTHKQAATEAAGVKAWQSAGCRSAIFKRLSSELKIMFDYLFTFEPSWWISFPKNFESNSFVKFCDFKLEVHTSIPIVWFQIHWWCAEAKLQNDVFVQIRLDPIFIPHCSWTFLHLSRLSSTCCLLSQQIPANVKTAKPNCIWWRKPRLGSLMWCDNLRFFTEIVRAMTYVINQGMAMYWGTSRWTAMEIMVSSNELPV